MILLYQRHTTLVYILTTKVLFVAPLSMVSFFLSIKGSEGKNEIERDRRVAEYLKKAYDTKNSSNNKYMTLQRF